MHDPNDAKHVGPIDVRPRSPMNNPHDVPIFGEPEPGVTYLVRPSAFGLVTDDRGRLAVVRTPQGMFLPGGGIEAGETPAEAVVREAVEECALVVRIGGWKIHAVQFVYSEPEAKYFEKHCTFVDAVVESLAPSNSEPDHELVWMEPDAASGVMSHESLSWAIAAWGRRVS